MTRRSIPTLIINGPVGVGKSTVAQEMSEQLVLADVPHAYLDIDAFTQFHPRPVHDPFAQRVALESVRRLWPVLEGAGADRLIFARVIETIDQLGWFRDAIPNLEITVVRLSAGAEVVADRIRRREIGSGLEWSLARAVELAAAWERESVADYVVETTGRTVREVAAEVLDRAGWISIQGAGTAIQL